MLSNFQRLLPGLGVAVITGLAALFLSEHYGSPVMLLALLLGIAIAFLYEETKCKDGIDFAASTILKAGVALIGLRLAISDLVDLGWKTGLLLVCAIISTMLIGHLLARLAGLPKHFGFLTGGAVGICGASAALAISSVLPEHEHKDRDTVLTVIGVTILSTIAMVLYPSITSALDMNTKQGGIFLGGTIHDVAQVVGAGYSVSVETGDIATLTKLVRVSLLVPVIMILLFTLNPTQSTGKKKAPVPAFLVVFIVLMLINSFIDLPSTLVKGTNELSRFALILAMTAIGMKSNLSKLLEVGLKPVAIMLCETLWIAGVILLGIKII